jgi:hypothetical protein
MLLEDAVDGLISETVLEGHLRDGAELEDESHIHDVHDRSEARHLQFRDDEVVHKASIGG